MPISASSIVEVEPLQVANLADGLVYTTIPSDKPASHSGRNSTCGDP